MGELQVNGTSTQPVTFSSAGSSSSSWYGIVLGAGANNAVLNHVDISKAVAGLRLSMAANPLNASQLTIHDCVTGIVVAGQSLGIHNVPITNCNTGVLFMGSTSATLDRMLLSGGGTGVSVSSGAIAVLENCIISSNSSAAVDTATTGSVNVTLNGCTIYGNGGAYEVQCSPPSVTTAAC